MSLYNIINGFPPDDLGEFLVDKVLGGSQGGFHVGRFRDIEIISHNSQLFIRLTTRDGGNNRECSNPDDGNDCMDCSGCNQTHWLTIHQLYLGDIDDKWDCTYAITYFSIPSELLDQAQKLYDKYYPKGNFDTNIEQFLT